MIIPERISPMIPGILNRFRKIGARRIINNISEKMRTELPKGV
jgi:hypothetical protein